jgi:rod shape-determining protein MreD
MRFSRIIILTVILAFLQITILDYFKVFGVKPDLILIAVFIAVLFLDLKSALGVGLLAGVFKDVFTSNVLGFSAALFPIWVLLIANLIKRVSIEDNISRIFLLFVVALLNNVISGLVLIYSIGFLSFGIFLRITFLASAYTALILALILRIIKR